MRQNVKGNRMNSLKIDGVHTNVRDNRFSLRLMAFTTLAEYGICFRSNRDPASTMDTLKAYPQQLRRNCQAGDSGLQLQADRAPATAEENP